MILSINEFSLVLYWHSLVSFWFYLLYLDCVKDSIHNMEIPERADLQIFNDYVAKINVIVELSNNNTDQVQMQVKRVSREIENSRLELGEYLYFVASGMLAGFDNKINDVHHYFLSAVDINPSTRTYIQYVKTLMNCFNTKEAFDLACLTYDLDGTDPEVYALIGETAMHSGLLNTSIKWLRRYERAVDKAHKFTQELEAAVALIANIDEQDLCDYITAAVNFMRDIDVKPSGQTYRSIVADVTVLEVVFATSLTAEESANAFFNFVTSDYILGVPDDILDSVTINFVPHAS